MKERPILFSEPMVRAILEGRKTQTRRIVGDRLKLIPRWSVRGAYIYSSTFVHGGQITSGTIAGAGAVSGVATNGKWLGLKPEEFDFCCPYCTGKTRLLDDRRWMIVPDAGQRLWVRENGWQPKEPTCRELCEGADTWPKYVYDADGITEAESESYREWGWKRRPSIHMPRWASRITLEVMGVRVERLHDISDADCRAEGITDELKWAVPGWFAMKSGFGESILDLWAKNEARKIDKLIIHGPPKLQIKIPEQEL